MTFKCIHIADIHFRGIKRHEEYRQVFEEFFIKAKKINPDIIYIGGDIVHSKTQGITPELIDIVTWWLKNLSEIAPVHMILGNHDGLILNEDRQDAISPIVNAIGNNNIYLYKQSGVYPLEILDKKINLCVFSCFDEKSWDKVRPVKDEINIALYHGGVVGSLTDIDWEINGEIEIDFFKGYDFAFLGDIHKMQYLDDQKRIAYSGSTIQQNYGEDEDKGFLLWEINSKYDYSSSFHTLKNKYKFLNINFKNSVQDTINEYASVITENARVRIISEDVISNSEINELTVYLKNNYKVSEVVSKVNTQTVQPLSIKNTKYDSFNINSSEARQKLINNFFKNTISKEETQKIDNLFDYYLTQITLNDSDISSCYSKWKIESIKFNNTFAYGENNFINFKKLNGLVGVFGKNRTGKSSIVGTLMYGLFNSTDRGVIKNLNIVNENKKSCDVELKISVDDKYYLIKRATNKKSNKRGEVSASTNLELLSIDSEGNVINQTDEQRRETEKILKSLIGTPEDFLMTSFASQGNINSFIEEKSSNRKSILTKFLNLDVFEYLFKYSRDQSAEFKYKQKMFSEKDWISLIEEQKLKIKNINNDIEKTSKDITECMSKKVALEIYLSNIKTDQTITYEECLTKISELQERINELSNKENKNKESINELIQKINKIKVFKENFDVEELYTKKARIDNLKENLNSIMNTLSFKDFTKNKNEKSLKILQEVPCGDKFTNCKFIKDAHEINSTHKDLLTEIESLNSSAQEILTILQTLTDEEVDVKIQKYNKILENEKEMNFSIKNIEIEISKINLENQSLIQSKNKYEELIPQLINNKNDNTIIDKEKIKSALKQVDNTLNNLNSLQHSLISQKAKCDTLISNYENTKKEYEEFVSEYRTFQFFEQCISKKGIPTLLIETCLPAINKELTKILTGVTNFNVELQFDDTLSSLDVYVVYDKARRLIECCSGMEKMFASIALRVVLTNMSSIPRSNIFIIDEGFGTLDAGNTESCIKMFNILKIFFKTVLIISHVDIIKESVDSFIEIKNENGFSNVRLE